MASTTKVTSLKIYTAIMSVQEVRVAQLPTTFALMAWLSSHRGLNDQCCVEMMD